jgi:hypothetical protein
MLACPSERAAAATAVVPSSKIIERVLDILSG